MSQEALASLRKQFLDNCEANTYFRKMIQNAQRAVDALERDNQIIDEKYKEIEKNL